MEKFSLLTIHGRIKLLSIFMKYWYTYSILIQNSGPKPWSDDFIVYVEQRGYDLLTVNEYENTLQECGFINIKCEDITWTFVDYLIKELEKFITNKEEFVKVLYINH